MEGPRPPPPDRPGPVGARGVIRPKKRKAPPRPARQPGRHKKAKGKARRGRGAPITGDGPLKGREPP